MRRWLVCVCLLFSFVAGQASGAEKSKPNLIIIIADDLAWNDVGCYGHPHIRTPHLDRMAKQGMRFDAAFLTISSCSPSRCSILTGRYPHSTGAGELHMPLPADQVTFAALLKKAGYYVAAGGKWHLGNNAKSHFDRIEAGRPSGCEKWIKMLKDRPKDRPFFMWMAAIDAHRPYSKKIIDKPHTRKDVVVPPFLPDVPATRDDLAAYYDEVSRLDEYVGKVLAELERQGIAKNTLVLFMSDNGRPFPRCKTTVYDSGVKTPFIVRWPARVKAGTVCDSLVSAVDIAPTFMQLAGLKPSPKFQGKSFVKLLDDPKATIREYVFAEHNWHDYQAHERSARSKDFLYIRNAFPHLPGTPPADAVRSPTYQAMVKMKNKLPKAQRGTFVMPRPKEELFDVRKDPHCLQNLASNPRYAATMERMRGALDVWVKRTEDDVPDNPTPDRYHRTTGVRLKPR